jgi:hypothetical protein
MCSILNLVRWYKLSGHPLITRMPVQIPCGWTKRKTRICSRAVEITLEYYNADAVKTYNTTSSPVGFKNENIFSPFAKTRQLRYYNTSLVVVNAEVVELTPGVKIIGMYVCIYLCRYIFRISLDFAWEILEPILRLRNLQLRRQRCSRLDRFSK